jgi:phage terminase Nu1 subunit (DNA packaging protein)
MPARTAPIVLTQEEAAAQLGVSDSTLRKGLMDLNLDIRGKRKIPIRVWVKCIIGDIKAERTRLTRAHADLLELNRLRLNKEVADIADVKAFYGPALAGLRQVLLESPSALCYQMNPSDPELARSVLHDFLTRTLDSFSRRMEDFIPADAREPAKPKTTKRTAPRTRGVVGRAVAAATA